MSKFFLTDADLMHDIETAQEKLLVQAHEILAKTLVTDDQLEMSKRLNSLGFNSSASVKTTFQTNGTHNEQLLLAGVVEVYMRTYPNNKFINDDIVSQICKKYKLVVGPVGRYLGEIPLKNQKEIIDFKFYSQDFRADEVAYGDEIRRRRYSGDNERDFIKNWLADKQREIRKNVAIDYNNLRTSAVDLTYSSTIIGGTGLVIIAPKKKFDLKDMEVKGHSLFNIKPLLITDPIVLQPVKNGYLIVSAWGKEASDPLVVNPKHN